MWFGKSIMKKLGLALAMAVPAFAADLEPFNFANAGSGHDAQQKFWNNLMKYKIFGAHGIKFIGGEIFVTDSSGWFGTADGSFDMGGANKKHTIGGPILIGGKIVLSNGQDTLSTGPVLVTKGVEKSPEASWDGPNVVKGTQCLDGTVFADYAALVGSYNSYSSCPIKDKYFINDKLTIPTIPGQVAEHDSMVLNNNLRVIDVPKATDADPGSYDYYIKGIKFENNSVLVVRMPHGGRLTRIFVGQYGMDMGSAHPKIRIVYMKEDAVWTNGNGWGTKPTYNQQTKQWSDPNATPVENKNYAGNLLIYTDKGLTFNALVAQDSMEGTFISSNEIYVKQHMTLAGQLLADSVKIDAQFDGTGFRFVPFDPDTLDPTALAKGRFPENGVDVEVPIQLDSNAQVDVHFKYCFDLDMNKSGYADRNDFNVPSNGKFPICSKGDREPVMIPMGSLVPTTATKVYINVAKDNDKEGDEKLILRIYDLTGAVMPGDDQLREGEFELTIVDMNGPQFNDDVKTYNVKENTKKGVVFDSIPIKNVDVAVADADKFTLEVAGSDATLAKTLFNFELIREARKDADVYDTAYIKMSVKTADLDYETLTKNSFKLTFRLKNDETVTDSTIRTINVIDINEVPDIKKIYDPKLTVTAGNFDTLSVKENSAKGDTVGVVNAVDPDIYNVIAYGHLAFSIVEGSSVPFTMKDSVIVVNDASKMNHETKDSVYTFTVKVNNCELATNGTWTKNCLATTHEVTVKIENVPEKPVLECFDDDLDCAGPYFAIENSKVDSVIHMFRVSDPDKGQLATLVPKIIDKKTNKDAVLFYADISNDTLRIKVKKNIDFETNDEAFNVTISITDADNLSASVNREIDLVDVNETPWVTGITDLNKDYSGTHATVFTIYPKENLKKGDSVGVVKASDPDTKNVAKFGHLEYSIVDPNGTVPFEMRNDTIVVKHPDSLNFELANVVKYVFDVKVTNCEWNPTTNKPVTGGVCRDTTQTVTAILQNVPEGPEINCKVDANGVVDPDCKGPYNVKENSKKGTLVHDFIVTDPDKNQISTMKASLVDSKTNGIAGDLFEAVMKGDSLRIVVKDSAKLNYEKIDPSYTVIVTVKDTDGLQDTIIRKINVVDINEAPVFATKDTTIEVKENTPNGTVVGKLPASDPDTKHVKEFGHLEYFIIGNNIPFAMDSNKIVVTNVDTLDYESLKPDTTFVFYVQVKNCELNSTSGKYDGACLYDTAKVSLAVTDVPEKTVIIPDCKGDSCTTCTGPDCHDIVDSLCKGPNCTGVHTHDSVLTLAVEENVPTGYKIIDYPVSDEDVGTGHKDMLIASFKNTNTSGADSLFKIEMKKVGGQWRVIVSVKDSSKLDYEKVNDIHKLTIYVSDPEDPAGMGDSIRRIIEVVDVNEAPKAKDADLKPEENLPKGTVIGKLDVSEPDTKHVKEFGHLEYSIIGKDETFAFVMDSNKVLVNDPNKMDYELAVHKYVFNVLISNCELNSTSGKYDGACLYDTAKVTVDIQDVNEKPKIIVDGPVPDGDDDSDTLCVAVCDTTDRGVKSKDSILTIGVRENPDNPNGTKKIVTPTGMILFQYHVADEDTNHATKAKVSWFDAGTTIPGVSTKGSDLFTIAYDSVKHVITVRVKDEKLLDYETLRNATSRDDPDPEYTMGIVVTDPKGLADTLYRKIRVTDENEKPLFDVWPLVITENNHINDSLGHVEHPSDIDSMSRNPELYDNGFKMTGGDTALFWLDKDSTDLMRVMIRANVVLDCENGDYICGQDSMYWVYMTYGDTTLKTVYTDLKIPVKLIDLNEPPKILTDTIGVDENSPKGTVVDTIKWDDIDRFDTAMTFKIVDDPIGCFDIDSKTGVVTVSADKCAGLDFEKNPTIDLKVSITDMVNIPDSLYDEKCKCQLISAENGPITVTKTVKVNIHDVNEPPSITDKTITVKEDTKPGTVVDTVRATDPDKDPKKRDLTYKLVGGDTTTFKIDPKTGALTLIDTLDYEAKNSYYVLVQVDDGEFADIAKVKINIGNIEEWTKLNITEASTDKKKWENPETIYTNHAVREICWNQDGFDTCMTNLNIAKDSVVVISWKNPTKDHAGSDTLRIYFSDATPEMTVTGKPTLVDAENVFTLVEDMEGDTNIYINSMKDSVWVSVKDTAGKKDTSFAIEVNLDPVTVSQATLDKMSKIADSKLMRDETGKKVTEVQLNSNQIKVSYNEIVGQDTVTITYLTDKNGNPVKVPVINDKGKVDSVEVITVTYKTRVGGNTGKDVEVSYQADALTGEIFAKGPSGELMEQGASKTLFAATEKDSTRTSSRYTTNEGIFTITTSSKDVAGTYRTISYAVDKKGNMVKNTEGDAGFAVTYTYENKYGNVATKSVFIVVDMVLPKVEILSPVNKEIIRSNSVKVVWTVDGVVQDTLTLQGLSKGPNPIVRIYRDKAGNEASATVYVYMKDSKDVDISVEQPVTEISKEKIDEYYAINPPEKGETFAVSIRNPTTGEEVETLIGGDFKTKKGSGKEPYPGASGSKHLGPTLAMDIKVPVIDAISGLATLDDLITPDGMIALERTNSKKSHKITVEQYVKEFCEDGFKIGSDASKVNLFDIKMHAQIWVYTSLGNFVDYFKFTQELNDPTFTDDAGLLEMYFEMKPDKDGFVKADNGKQYATGAFVYKVQANIRSKARCTIPDASYNPESIKKCDAKKNDCDGYGSTTKRKGDVVKNSDELLKSFGYRRPKHK